MGPDTDHRRRAVLLGLPAALLAACTTPYQPKGAMGGFSERRLGPGQYSVEFSGNGHTSAALVANMFLYRCAELTLRDGYDVFRSADPGSPGAEGWSQPMAQPAAGGPAQPEDFKSGAVRTIPIYIPAQPVTIHRMTGQVRMGRYADVPSTVRVWDARAVVQRLDPVVRNNGRAPYAPDELARVALVAGRGQATAGVSGGTSLDDLRRLLAQPQE